MTQELDVIVQDPMLRAVLQLPRWTPAQTQLVVHAQRRSGLPVAVFCQQVGIKVWRLYKGQRTHGNKLDKPSPACAVAVPEPFVPVSLMTAAIPTQDERPCAELLTPSGQRLRLWATAPQSWLKTLCQALGQTC